MEECMPCPNCNNLIGVRPIREGGEIDGICSNDLAGYCQHCQKHYEFSFDELEVYEKSLGGDYTNGNSKITSDQN